MDSVSIVKKYYDDNPVMEWERLSGFSYEFEITKHYLQKHMKGKRVLDIGGGPGRYAIYLAEQGYDVTLVDLSEGNIALAKEKATEHNVAIRAYACNALDLSALPLESYDTILLMGPMYHLLEADAREKCVLEVSKYLAPDGVLFASFIQLSAGLLYCLSDDVESIVMNEEMAPGYLECIAENRTWCGHAFTDAAFVSPFDIEPFFDRMGYEKIVVFAQEGITGAARPETKDAPEHIRDLYLKQSLRMCENPYYFALSDHLMYVGKKVRNAYACTD